MSRVVLSPERKNFVLKTYNEMYDYAFSSTPSREARKSLFLSLISKCTKYTEDEKAYCRQKFIHNFELNNALYKCGKSFTCKNCKSIRYSDKYCEICIRDHLKTLFGRWTSGNEKVDKFIQDCQLISSLPRNIMEWIPYDQFEDIEYMTEGGFSVIYKATWIRGCINDWNEEKKEFVRFHNQKVILKCLLNSGNPNQKFFEEVINNIILW